jgi:hypothetical protein
MAIFVILYDFNECEDALKGRATVFNFNTTTKATIFRDAA